MNVAYPWKLNIAPENKLYITFGPQQTPMEKMEVLSLNHMGCGAGKVASQGTFWGVKLMDNELRRFG